MTALPRTHRLADAGPSTAADASSLGESASFEAAGIEFSQPGLLTSDPDLAIALDGSTGATRSASADPTAYTLETWFRYSGNPSPQVLIARIRADTTWAQLLGISAEGRLQHWVWDGHELGLHEHERVGRRRDLLCGRDREEWRQHASFP